MEFSSSRRLTSRRFEDTGKWACAKPPNTVTKAGSFSSSLTTDWLIQRRTQELGLALLEVLNGECGARVEQFLDGVASSRDTDCFEARPFPCIDIKRRIADDVRL